MYVIASQYKVSFLVHDTRPLNLGFSSEKHLFRGIEDEETDNSKKTNCDNF